jgi:nicotinamidase/pyrazinamidase
MPIDLPARAALIVIDVQNSFLPGGSLAVPNGDEVIAVINGIAKEFENVVLTQDWHPPGHVSFASSHPGRRPLERITLDYGPQVLWPDHCVQGTAGAAIADRIDIPHAQLVLRKGFRRRLDSYSAFIEADGGTRTGLDGYLRARGIDTVYLVGLATDFCVAWTAIDARRLGFSAHVVENACRAIDVEDSLARAWTSMDDAGVERVRALA